jgi:prolyl oligopeptidase
MHWKAFAIAFTLGASALFAAEPVAERPRPDYPHTRALDLVEPQFGEKVADPFRWLENDVRSDAEVRKWVDDQNKVTQAYLAKLPGRDRFAGRLKQLYDFERIGVPKKGGNRYFYTRNNGRQNQSVLHVREGAGGADRVLIDPNGWSKDNANALAEWTPSDDGRFLLYAVQEGGSDWRTLKVLDVATGKDLPDRVSWVKFSSLAWMKDGSGFFYSRFPAPGEDEYRAVNLNQSVWFHRIGTTQDQDAKIYATPGNPRYAHSAQVTDDGRYLLVTTAESTDDRFELHVAPLDGGPIKLRPLVRGLDHKWEMAGSVGSTFYFLTDKDAPKGRMVTIDVEKRRAKPQQIVAQSADTLVGASLVGDRLILAYLGDAKSQAELHTLDGRLIAPIRLPDIGAAAGFGGKGGDSETFYSFSSFATPPTVYRYDTATGKAEIFFQPKVAFDPKAYLTEQRFFNSKDGTRVPMFLVRKRDAVGKGPMPALLYGYGGFNISQTPGFSASRLAWLEAGGALAVANLRGGGEYGAEWHDAGRLSKKQNVFDDFIAAAEYLIAEGVTAKGKLAIQGGSNGGLLVGAVVNQRPDLFAAALPAVGVMDMLRFAKFTAGRYWVDDYGDPENEADFRVLRAYSPYHNIKNGADYPAILVTTADTDDRVVPGHSFKYAAALQAADIGSKPHLIRIETRAGHGNGKPIDKIVAEASDQWAFIAKWTGMEVPAK